MFLFKKKQHAMFKVHAFFLIKVSEKHLRIKKKQFLSNLHL